MTEAMFLVLVIEDDRDIRAVLQAAPLTQPVIRPQTAGMSKIRVLLAGKSWSSTTTRASTWTSRAAALT